MIAGIPRETCPGERRVAMVPQDVARLTRLGLDVLVERGAGFDAGFEDREYEEKGAQLASREEVFSRADIVLQVRAAGANPERYEQDLALYRRGQAVVAQADPLGSPEPVRRLAEAGVTAFALELIPRITRAQSMDVLSSQASIAGYKAVLIAAMELPRMFPMLNTAAGTIKPAKVLVVGAGVAGLQAIATARRLGSIVFGYDIRPAVREQIESLGAKFVEIDLGVQDTETEGGYAKEVGEEVLRRQREALARQIEQSDVVITTAAVPGKKAPRIVTAEMVTSMAPGSVIVDLAAERGGNCELTRAGETVVENGVRIVGPVNVPATVPYHASQMYARNVATFTSSIVKDGALVIDTDDEVVRETLVTRDGEVVSPRVRELLGLPPLPEPAAPAGGEEGAP
ncbi:MAG: Re/Si-specific NAD(P)(+) transhydrogenase subunit alpha [Acidobacteriota bacterium]